MTDAVARYMSSTYAIDSAWTLLKQEDSPADYDLTQLMSEKDKSAATKYMASLSPQRRRIINQIQENFTNLPPDVKGQLTGLSHKLLEQHEGQLSQILPQSPHAGNQVEKAFFIPALVIGTVLALDAINTSQGAKASLVGNVFADAGNTISAAVGGPPKLFGETNYSDVFDYENQASVVNPLTGREHMVNDDPGFFERLGKGALSAGLSFVNPFAVAGAGAKGISRVAGKANQKLGQSAGKAVSQIGEKISQSRLAQRGTDKARQKAVANAPSVEMQQIARDGARGRVDRLGQSIQGKGRQITDSANATQAQRVTDFNQAVTPGALAGGGRTSNVLYRPTQMFTRTPVGQGLNPNLPLALLSTYGMSKLPQAPTTGFGAQSQMGAVGAAPTQGTQVSGNADPYALREIYNPKAGSAFEGQKEFGGLGVQKGDNMFRKNIGEELLSEAAYRLHKAHCGTELKADCPKGCKGCPECDGDNKKKADDKKKPAHGMVIVIGSKAGPGPSKDGKREKLDSEKKKE